MFFYKNKIYNWIGLSRNFAIVLVYFWSGVIFMKGYIKIATIYNEVEAKLLETILSENNIPHIIQSNHSAIYDGIFQLQKGWGYVSAPQLYEEYVLNILDNIRKDS